MSERVGGYTTKTYNLLALALLLKGDLDRALKIFETALSALKLETDGQWILKQDNKDVSTLVYNYIKTLCIKRGQNQQQFEFVKSDPETKKLFAYLVSMQSPLGRGFFEER
jgi:uncharacterized membrane protein YfbV (UPF0208 family)